MAYRERQGEDMNVVWHCHHSPRIVTRVKMSRLVKLDRYSSSNGLKQHNARLTVNPYSHHRHYTLASSCAIRSLVVKLAVLVLPKDTSPYSRKRITFNNAQTLLQSVVDGNLTTGSDNPHTTVANNSQLEKV